jgi:uncharacterized membrane protein
MQRWLVVAHVAGIGVFLGASVLLAVLLEVVGKHAPDARARRERWAEIFSVYSPVSIAALGVVVMTGAWSLTPYKQAFAEGYFEQVGSALAGKLTLAFFLIMTATWIAFGICHRVVRAHQGDLPVSDRDLAMVRMRLRVALWLAFALTLATLWIAFGMQTPALPR